MFVGLYEFIFSSAFPSDLSDHWSGKDLQHFSYHKKEKTMSSEIYVLVTRKCLESFQFCHEVLWEILWKSVLLKPGCLHLTI